MLFAAIVHRRFDCERVSWLAVNLPQGYALPAFLHGKPNCTGGRRRLVVELGGHRQLRVVRDPQPPGSHVNGARHFTQCRNIGLAIHERYDLVGIVRAGIRDEQGSRVHLPHEVCEELLKLPILIDEAAIGIERDETEEPILVDVQKNSITHAVRVVTPDTPAPQAIVRYALTLGKLECVAEAAM